MLRYRSGMQPKQKIFTPLYFAGMTAADMAELCARIREPGVAKTLRCVRMGPPVDNGGALPEGLVSDGIVPLLSGPRRLEVRRIGSPKSSWMHQCREQIPQMLYRHNTAFIWSCCDTRFHSSGLAAAVPPVNCV